MPTSWQNTLVVSGTWLASPLTVPARKRRTSRCRTAVPHHQRIAAVHRKVRFFHLIFLRYWMTTTVVGIQSHDYAHRSHRRGGSIAHEGRAVAAQWYVSSAHSTRIPSDSHSTSRSIRLPAMTRAMLARHAKSRSPLPAPPRSKTVLRCTPRTQT